MNRFGQKQVVWELFFLDPVRNETALEIGV